ncbi:MAG: UDP-glycosyltransferase [Burkholderiaceae bacterium]
MKRRALFVSYGGGHVSMVMPVIRALRESRPDIECVLMALTTGLGKARAAGFEAVGYRDFLYLGDREAALRRGAQLQAGNTSPDVPADESAAYLGINYQELVDSHGEEGAAALYAERGRYGFRPTAFMRRVIREIAPDVVVATNSPRSEEAALEAAADLGIPAVGMIDLFGTDADPYVWRARKPLRTCVISQPVRQRLLARGFDPAGVVVTGNPAFDGLASPENAQQAEAFLAARGWQGLAPILFTGNIEPATHPATPVAAGHSLSLEAEGVLREMVRNDPSLALVIRYHPSEWHTYPPHVPQERVHFSIPSQEPIHPLILAARAVVVQNSTVGLESAVAGRPVVSLENSPSAHAGFSLAALGVSTGCPSPAALPQVLDAVLSREAAVPREYRSDGRAAGRVADVVAGCLGVGATSFEGKSGDALK